MVERRVEERWQDRFHSCLFAGAIRIWRVLRGRLVNRSGGHLTGIFHPGLPLIQEQCDQSGIPFRSLLDRYRESIENGVSPYRDVIHPNPHGQALMAEEMFGALRDIGLIDSWVRQAQRSAED